MFKAKPRPAAFKKRESEMEKVGQQETNNVLVGNKAPFLSKVVGKM